MENLVVPSLGGPTIVSTRAGSLGVSTTRTIAGCLLAGCLRLSLKVRLNRSQRHRPKDRSGWFIGVHSWPLRDGEACSCGGSGCSSVGALTGPKRILQNQPELARSGDGLGAVPCAELAVDVACVALDGAHRDEEISGYF